MYPNDPNTRFEAALRLAEVDPACGADALTSIAASDEFDPDTRFEAAIRLAEVDSARGRGLTPPGTPGTAAAAGTGPPR